MALGRFPFAEEGEEGPGSGDDDSHYGSGADSDDYDDDDDDDLRGTLSPMNPSGTRVSTQAMPAAGQKKKTGHRKSKSRGGVSLGGGSGQMSMLELLQRIVNEPPPRLPLASTEQLLAASKSAQANTSTNGRSRRPRRRQRPVGFPPDLVRFVDLCVTKDPAQRPTPKELCEGGAPTGSRSPVVPMSKSTTGTASGRATANAPSSGLAGDGRLDEFVKRCEEKRDRGLVDVKAWVDGLV